MKKVILLLLAIVALTSCEKYCPYCNEYERDCRCERNGITYNYDHFYADKLLGTWQCDYNTTIGTMNLKEIDFFSSSKCDIIYSIGKNTEWYTETFDYSYVGKYLRFSRGRTNFSLYIKGYIFPELYLEDSFGEYTWRKVKSYGC